MNSLSEFDWSLVQSFLAVAEEGSLSQAARRLGSSQPTVGRQIKQLEVALDLTLFHRKARGLDLTEEGQDILPHARRMLEAISGISLSAAARSNKLAGPVRATAPVLLAHYYLPPIVADLRRQVPEISLDIVANDETDNLLFREADIAVRMYRPDQLEIIARHVGDFQIGAYAAKSYLDRVGHPETFADALGMDMIGYDRSTRILDAFADLGVPLRREDFPVRTDTHSVYFELVRSGCGIGFLQTNLAETDPDLVRLFPEIQAPPLPVWLAAPEAMRNTPRIRRVWDALETGLRKLVS